MRNLTTHGAMVARDAYTKFIQNRFTSLDGVYAMKFQVLTAANIKMTVFWDIVSCRPVEIN
jgi:hypothetical protein